MFDKILQNWGGEDFTQQLEKAIQSLDVETLPLASCCQHSGVVDFDTIKPIILNSKETQTNIQVKLGVFFAEILSGCACSDDPSQAQALENNYCELVLSIDKTTAQVSLTNA